VFGTYHGASTIMRRAFEWKHSRISMFDVEAVPHSGGDTCSGAKYEGATYVLFGGSFCSETAKP
jgi:hypothetical protein